VLDLKQESDALYTGYLTEAIHLSLAGALALIVLLLIALRSPLRVARVLTPLMWRCLRGRRSRPERSAAHHPALGGHAAHRCRWFQLCLVFDRQASPARGSQRIADLASLVIAQHQHRDRLWSAVVLKVPVLVALGHQRWRRAPFWRCCSPRCWRVPTHRNPDAARPEPIAPRRSAA